MKKGQHVLKGRSVRKLENRCSGRTGRGLLAAESLASLQFCTLDLGFRNPLQTHGPTPLGQPMSLARLRARGKGPKELRIEAWPPNRAQSSDILF